ncbi:MAG: hydantoinase B/oxoprolinase family protein [Desulfobulbaceae bacterium]|jgi:N-methylhydantoinase B|nr:hydantoinase B/oxoprolinase family protein [Desulfobulbaceae bacterium]
MNVIEVQIFNKIFSSIAEEMGIVLSRAAFSSNIKERKDFSCAIFDNQGELVAQAAHIPVHLGAMPETVKYCLQIHDFKELDEIIVNDPFHGGSHLPDITLIKPVFWHSELLFYTATRAHHADVGGISPGSMGNCTCIDDEGVRIPPTLLKKQGQTNQQFLDHFLQQVRNPLERTADLKAQSASLDRGGLRLMEIVEKYGKALLFITIKDLKQYSETLMLQTIKNIPDGEYHFSDFLDNDGTSTDPLELKGIISITGDKACVDLSGSCDQVRAPLNSVRPVAISATIYAFQCLMGEGFPINHGSYRPISIITRSGSILDAREPAPVAAGNVETSQRIVDVLFGCLAQAIPQTIPAASCGTMNNVSIGWQNDNGIELTYYETIGGGMGARPTMDGLSGIQTHMTNTLNTPIEDLEHDYPMRIEVYGIRSESGGKGKYNGGNGIIRSYRFLQNASVSLLTDRRVGQPYGLHGGQNGKSGLNILIRYDGTEEILPGKSSFTVQVGDLLRIETPGGGGFGQAEN